MAGGKGVIRIRGIVKAAEITRNRLQAGIPKDEVRDFQEFVAGTIAQIQCICAEENIGPTHLPTPSRKAYQFLTQIDLHNLPVVEETAQVAPWKPIRMKNIRNQQQQFLSAIAKLAQNPHPSPSETQNLRDRIEETVTAIEQICAKQNATPAALSKPSRHIYAWMKFLTDESNLQRHLSATRRSQQMAEKMLWGLCAHSCETIAVHFIHMAHLYKGRLTESAATLHINEGFVSAKDEVLRALVTAGLWEKTPELSQTIRQYILCETYRDTILELDWIVDAEAETAKGKCYDLEILFEKVNREYFDGQMEKPRMTWNRAFTARKFAHYERWRDRIVMSISLDSDRVPQFVVEFVLYHELLHKKHSEKWVNGRLTVHTPEFRREEQRFKQYCEADKWLTLLASQ